VARLTITLSEERHQALKEAAARRKTSIGRVIEESLDFYGIKTCDAAARLVARVRRRSKLDERAALDLALRETRAERRS